MRPQPSHSQYMIFRMITSLRMKTENTGDPSTPKVVPDYHRTILLTPRWESNPEHRFMKNSVRPHYGAMWGLLASSCFDIDRVKLGAMPQRLDFDCTKESCAGLSLDDMLQAK